ncbi:MAG: hypothetical protein JEZ14_04825 [Marinilabiliaceae bacterium]|nr:hypothetical protein [Marinilabiliaceae bacterium]
MKRISPKVEAIDVKVNIELISRKKYSVNNIIRALEGSVYDLNLVLVVG